MDLFIAGFVLVNELNMYNEATETYNLFMVTLPEHELADSVKGEFNNIGLTLKNLQDTQKGLKLYFKIVKFSPLVRCS
jgi:hypothetical protein